MPGLRERINRSHAMAGRVKRYACWPTLHTQTVGEHSARVANIYISVFGLPRAEVLFYALNHDAGELLAGDIPFGGKDKVPGLRTAMNAAEQYGLAVLDLTLPVLTLEEQARIKIADLLEMHEFGRIEELMGNRLAAPVTTDTLAAALRKAAEINQISTVENWLLKQEDSI
jgi:5'-deoxynucleotidase YfbR-like HD superfamily hydrolase